MFTVSHSPLTLNHPPPPSDNKCPHHLPIHIISSTQNMAYGDKYTGWETCYHYTMRPSSENESLDCSYIQHGHVDSTTVGIRVWWGNKRLGTGWGGCGKCGGALQDDPGVDHQVPSIWEEILFRFNIFELCLFLVSSDTPEAIIVMVMITNTKSRQWEHTNWMSFCLTSSTTSVRVFPRCASPGHSNASLVNHKLAMTWEAKLLLVSSYNILCCTIDCFMGSWSPYSWWPWCGIQWYTRTTQ